MFERFNNANQAFVSDIDKFLADFNETHPKSASQQKEIKKYEQIMAKRDQAEAQEDTQGIWEGF